MKCFIRHTGQNFERCFGPFDSIEEANQWRMSPKVRRAGVRGAIVPLVPGTVPELHIWDVDDWEDVSAVRPED